MCIENDATMTLDGLRNWFTLRYEQFIEQNEIEGYAEDVRYEKIAHATRVDLSNGLHLFFQYGKLKMVYTSDEVVATKLWNDFQSKGNPKPEKTFRSRAGKTSNQLVFASQGLSVSLKNDEVDFIEVYPSCSLQEYVDNIYREPGRFNR